MPKPKKPPRAETGPTLAEEIARHKTIVHGKRAPMGEKLRSIAWLKANDPDQVAEAKKPAKPAPALIAQGLPTRDTEAAAAAAERKRKRDAKKRTFKLFSVLAEEVEERQTRYLWEGRIPWNRITIFLGMPNQGKSTFATWLASQISTGSPFPDAPGSFPEGSVLYFQAEETASEDIKPRLREFGADESKIHFVLGADAGDGTMRRWRIGQDIDQLEMHLDRAPGCRAVIFEPLTPYLGGINSADPEEVYNALLPLREVCERRDVAAIIVAHPNKNGEQDILHRIAGSQAFAAIARSYWVITPDPNDPTRRMMSNAKGNTRGMSTAPLAWSYTGGQLVFDTDCGAMSAQQVQYLLAKNAKRDAIRANRRGPEKTTELDARKAILDALAAGPAWRAGMQESVVSDRVSESTFRRALDYLEGVGDIAIAERRSRKAVLYRLADPPEDPPAAPVADQVEPEPTAEPVAAPSHAPACELPPKTWRNRKLAVNGSHN